MQRKWLCSLSVGLLAACIALGLMAADSPPSAPTDSSSKSAAGASATSDATKEDRAAVEILAQNCQRCHGSAKQEGGLRLDRADKAKLGGDSGVAFVTGKSEKSRLIRYVLGKGDTVMPPKGSRLSPEQVATLAAWIDRGAKWPADDVRAGGKAAEVHSANELPWSFQPVHRPDVPRVKRTGWIRNEIDAFVLARLEREGLSPAAEADRATLIRRLSLDLRGLPPADVDVTEFLTDKRPDAYERLVDRYLASPQFGERWARHWLDRTHYAESSGCVIDLPRPYPWRWRDWVVAAINRDLPFDQFTVQQLAGDLLPDASVETRVATGLFRNALTNHEAGIDLTSERVKTTVDRTNTVAAAWLGVTLGCAECHSHKFDPITQRDFYRMYAFFDRLDEQDIDAPAAETSPSPAAARAELDRARAKYLSVPAAEQPEWEARVKRLPDVWSVPREWDARSLRSLGFAMVHPQADGSLTVDGRVRSSDRHHLTFAADSPTIRAVRVELLPDANRFQLGPGRCKNGDCILTSITVSAASADRPTEVQTAKMESVETDYCQSGFHAADAWAGTDEKGWAVDQPGVSHAAVFVFDSPLTCQGPTNVSVRLEFRTSRGRTPLRFRVAVTDAGGDKLKGQSVPADIRQLAASADARLSVTDRAALKRYYQSTHPADDAGLAEWNRARQTYAELVHPRGAECVQEGWQPRETQIHLRGDFHRPGDLVEPGVPAALEPAGKLPEHWTRLDLARWIVDPANPLTARVAVNSFWQPLFGGGLVRTPGDFGRQGEAPTHPELLDWLADQFVRDGWSRKATVRRIVCSATYRQSSTVSAKAPLRDPQNLFLSRQGRVRLDAEAIRDCVLDRAGLLNPRMGGPSYRQPQPDDEPTEDWEQATLATPLEDLYRRGLYVAIARTTPDPLLTTFDAPDGAVVCPLRQRTNTPIQAITLLNDPVFVAAARALSSSGYARGEGSVRERIERMWTHCLGRAPSPREGDVLEKLFREAATEDGTLKDGNAEYSAAWFVIARTILNLDETITRE